MTDADDALFISVKCLLKEAKLCIEQGDTKTALLALSGIECYVEKIEDEFRTLCLSLEHLGY